MSHCAAGQIRKPPGAHVTILLFVPLEPGVCAYLDLLFHVVVPMMPSTYHVAKEEKKNTVEYDFEACDVWRF